MKEELRKNEVRKKNWPLKADYEEQCPPNPTKKERSPLEQAQKDRFTILYNEVYIKEGESHTRIYEKISERYKYIPKSTFDDTATKDNLNALVVLAFCKTFGYDVYEIYPPIGEENAPELEESNPTNPGNDDLVDIEQELPMGFVGSFYGYFLNSTPDYMKLGIIDQFMLDIKSDHISLILKHYTRDIDLNNAYSPKTTILDGKILYNQGGSSPNGILALSFTSSDGNCFCTMAYNKFQLYGRLRFRRGALLIQSRGGNIMPTIQAFIFTDQKIDLKNEENKKIIQGVLHLANDTILVKKDDLEPFMDSELLKKYFELISYDKACKEYIELKEQLLREINIDDSELYQTLFQIKSKDANAGLYTFPIIDRAWHYIASLCDREDTSQQEQ